MNRIDRNRTERNTARQETLRRRQVRALKYCPTDLAVTIRKG